MFCVLSISKRTVMQISTNDLLIKKKKKLNSK